MDKLCHRYEWIKDICIRTDLLFKETFGFEPFKFPISSDETMNCSSKYYHTYNVSEWPDWLSAENISEDTLVVFDIDNVLLRTTDRIFQCHPYTLESDMLISCIKNGLDDRIVWEPYLFSRGRVDPKMPKFIEDFHNKKGIKGVFLTVKSTGYKYKDKDVEDVHIRELNQAGYNPKKSWPKMSKTVLLPSKLQLKYESLGSMSPMKFWTAALFKDGVIFTGDFPKEEALGIFLDSLTWKPKHIIFVDDRFCNHQRMEALANARKIESLGIVYNKVEEDNLKSKPFTRHEKARIKFQTDRFNELKRQIDEDEEDDTYDRTKMWLSDAQADKAMAAENALKRAAPKKKADAVVKKGMAAGNGRKASPQSVEGR